MTSPALPPATDRRAVRRFVLDVERRLEPLDRAILVADWDLQTGRSRRGAGRYQLQRARLLSAPGLLRWAGEARRTAGLSAPIRRRLELLERIVLDTEAEQGAEIVRLREEIVAEIVRFRPSWDGRRVNRAVVDRAFHQDPDPTRRKRAFYALQPLYRRLEGRFQRLVRLRNERARELGFPSFAHLRLALQGFTPAQVADFAETAATRVRDRIPALRDLLTDREAGGGWYPWNYVYARERRVRLPEKMFPARTMVPRILRAVGRWGFPVSRMRFRVVFHDLPAGGLTLAPDPPRDVRILVHPIGGWPSYHVMFHEIGHAVQSSSIRSPGHLLRWHENVPGFGAFHEGIGNFFERIAREPRWLREEVGVAPSTADAFGASRWDSDLLSAGWLGSWILPELSLYLHPDRDAPAVGQRFARRVFGYDAYPPLSPVDSFYVDTPLYSVNYLLAVLFNYQIAAALVREVGEPLWPNRKVGPWLTTHWFAPGSRIEWISHLREVTGRPFGPRAFTDWFRAG